MLINNLIVTRGKQQIIKDISLEFIPNHITVILGKNGSGKTTLLKAASSNLNYSGNITIDNKDLNSYPLKERAKLISYLPQNLPLPPIKVSTLLEYGRYPYNTFSYKLNDEDNKAIEQAINNLHLESLKDKLVCHLSGGERTRAFLGLIEVKDSPYILLDEPFASLDIPSKQELVKYIKELKAKNKTIIVTVHDLLLTLEIADNIILLDHGKLISNVTKEEFVKSKEYQSIFNAKIIKTKDSQNNIYYVTKNL